MIELPRFISANPNLNIKIVGLGGAGANILDRVHLDGLENVTLIAMNTDSQSLLANVAPVKVQLGRDTTRGLGTGGDPELGFVATEEAAGDIKTALDGASIVFLCAGLGGGTGSGSVPLVANFARQQRALVIAFVTLPFTFEGRRRMAQAEEAIVSLRQQADVVICFENDRMGDVVNPRAGIQEAFAVADQTVGQSVRAIAELLRRRGLIHAGFDDISAAMRAQDARSLFGFGEAEGDNRAHVALERALRNPLMDRGRLLAEVDKILVHVAGGPSMTLNEVTLLMEELNRHISDSTRLLFSTAVDPRLGGRISVAILGALGNTPHIVTTVTRIDAMLPPPVVSPVTGCEASPPTEVPDSVRAVAAEITPQLVSADAQPFLVTGKSSAMKPVNAASRAKLSREERQEQMTFEPVNRGRFEKSEPTIVDGQDLDVPAFMRMNVRMK